MATTRYLSTVPVAPHVLIHHGVERMSRVHGAQHLIAHADVAEVREDHLGVKGEAHGNGMDRTKNNILLIFI
jgi:hypothetical protein